ncbi:hypothetical protein FE697_012490 [Mumia zhuanghuii]|uniref:Uncharacterized protein n=2 Tax=Mumia TaxID=1546255 RepID=A0ABW1QRJ2_9ACTN|nr:MULTISPECIES: hypothetical protein [Mumia]KAA1422950.1 hypothetical protein FE697_012490 [Mumia zhuanghuii]
MTESADPTVTRPVPRTREQLDAERHALRVVQRRVAAVGFFAVTIHGVLGCIGLGFVFEGQGRHSDAILITIMSGVIAAITYSGVRVILQRPLWSPVWILLAALPTAFALGRLLVG